jgi:hypothetical protein
MKVRLFQDAPHKEGKYHHEILGSSLFQVSRNKKLWVQTCQDCKGQADFNSNNPLSNRNT